MESPKNRGDKAPTRYRSPPSKPPMPESCWPKRCHNPQTTQAIADVTDCSPQTDGEALLLKTALSYLTERREVKLMPTNSLVYNSDPTT